MLQVSLKKVHFIGLAKKFIQVFVRCNRKTQVSAKPVLTALSSNSVDEM